ncbi:putative imidazole glycerol phosphate synthase hishf [Diplodia seriata]|uniref:ATP-dependent DNA helicase CHL1 n=1 Tax=Diplodia seriata TaxID=420778 RepID=A0A0G2EIB9_9PEZI|nr:putative imidazole glycerol phosphate synthase hishf [Diplodia seriata]
MASDGAPANIQAAMERNFHHPYEPYEIQKQFMSALYECIEDGKVGILESPTDEDEPAWMLEYAREEKRRTALQQRADLEDRLAKVRAKEKKLKERYSNGEPHFKRQKTAAADTDIDDDDEARFILDDYESDDEVGHKDKSKRDPDSGGGAKVNIDGEVGEAFKHLTLGSRKNLCINPKVQKLGSTALINEKCLDLQKAGTAADHKCPFLPTKETEATVNDFRDHALADIRDIEDLGAIGRKLGICPYYASRPAVKPSEIVTLPYPLLLQKTAREALDINMKDHIVIIDEAHNLMDAISGIYSVSVSLTQLQRSRSQLTTLLDSLTGYLQGMAAQAKEDEGMVQIGDLMAGKGVDQINLYKLLRYLDESKLARKVDGYIVYAEEQEKSKDEASRSVARSSMPVLMHIQSFFYALLNPSAEGRFFYAKNDEDLGLCLKYMLLDPTHHFREIVDDARAVILAGGTMSPMSDYSEHLLSYLPPSRIMTLSCGHVIPPSNLLAWPVTTGPSGAPFDFTYEKRNTEATIVDLGAALLTFIRNIPDGVVIFFPSYAYLDRCLEVWRRAAPPPPSSSLSSNPKTHGQAKTIYDALASVKPVFHEHKSKVTNSTTTTNPSAKQAAAPATAPTTTQPSTATETVLSAYTHAITTGGLNGRGALLLAVVGGTLSEGINFSDALGRGVGVVGLPFPPAQSAEWKARMGHVARKARENGKGDGKQAAREYYENACMRAVNQCVGRAIRHRGDYAAILLVDGRPNSRHCSSPPPLFTMPSIHLLDYVAGNVRSLVNAIEKVGYTVEWIRSPEDVAKAETLILPGVGHFGHCMTQFANGGYVEPIRKHVAAGKPFMGICVGLQALLDGSEESSTVPGLGLIPGTLRRFDAADKSVPHIGWNSANTASSSGGGGKGAGESVYGLRPDSKYYYVHSYALPYVPGELEAQGWTVATARYGGEEFVGALAKDNVLLTQFHPEKSGAAGLRVLKAFCSGQRVSPLAAAPSAAAAAAREGLTRRVIACLDVRTNDAGDLVVTKGDQYDVREKGGAGGDQVRNLGKPVEMARRYYEQGADEVTFLNITSFRNCPVADLPMLEILRRASETVFVPLTIGGGIRDTVDTDGTKFSALDVAKLYFKSGADKVSIGSDAVTAAEEYCARGKTLLGTTAIETISAAYGVQAVVVSVDPKRKYVASPADTPHHTIKTAFPGPGGEEYCWYQCTIKGGRETRDFDVRQLVQAVEAMGAGEILLNCIDKDGSNSGFDLELINDVKAAVKIPVIASSGAGNPAHFAEVFEKTPTDAALGAGMFHRGEYTVKQVKDHLQQEGLLVRQFEDEI